MAGKTNVSTGLRKIWGQGSRPASINVKKPIPTKDKPTVEKKVISPAASTLPSIKAGKKQVLPTTTLGKSRGKTPPADKKISDYQGKGSRIDDRPTIKKVDLRPVPR
jgi:hypothetical protein